MGYFELGSYKHIARCMFTKALLPFSHDFSKSLAVRSRKSCFHPGAETSRGKSSWSNGTGRTSEGEYPVNLVGTGQCTTVRFSSAEHLVHVAQEIWQTSLVCAIEKEDEKVHERVHEKVPLMLGMTSIAVSKRIWVKPASQRTAKQPWPHLNQCQHQNVKGA